jgi:hypothetical protein
MKAIKQLRRLSVICTGLEWKPMGILDMKEYIWDKLQEDVCRSTIEKDVAFLKMEMDAPIKANRSIQKYSFTEKWNFKEEFMKYIEF